MKTSIRNQNVTFVSSAFNELFLTSQDLNMDIQSAHVSNKEDIVG